MSCMAEEPHSGSLGLEASEGEPSRGRRLALGAHMGRRAESRGGPGKCLCRDPGPRGGPQRRAGWKATYRVARAEAERKRQGDTQFKRGLAISHRRQPTVCCPRAPPGPGPSPAPAPPSQRHPEALARLLPGAWGERRAAALASCS